MGSSIMTTVVNVGHMVTNQQTCQKTKKMIKMKKRKRKQDLMKTKKKWFLGKCYNFGKMEHRSWKCNGEKELEESKKLEKAEKGLDEKGKT